jgi:nucleoside-triphosphatase THEP1
MAKVIFLTGAPGSGKTTALKKIISRLTVKTGGFYTEEIRERGARVGFKVVTLDGQESTLAHVKIRGKPRIGKYGIDLEAIEEVAVPSLLRSQGETDLIIIDEIGPMEILSKTFCQVVLNLLETEVHILGSIMKRSNPIANAMKDRPEVTVLEIRHDNRHQIVDQVLKLLDISSENQ